MSIQVITAFAESQTQGKGVSEPLDVSLVDMLTSMAIATAASGENLEVWLQVSPDKLTWWDLPSDKRLNGSETTIAEVFAVLRRRNLWTDVTDVEQAWTCLYQSVPYPWARLRWDAEGSGPVDLAVLLTGK